MTFIGKIFVMLNLVISLMMAAFGVGLYTSNVDWTERAAKGTEPAGLTAQRKAALKEAESAVPAVEAGWKDANEALMVREEMRQADQKWYTGELVHVRSKATEADPARDLDIPPDGNLRSDPRTRRPVMLPAKDRTGKNVLKSIAAYDGELKVVQADNETRLSQLGKEFEGDIVLTNRLTPPKGEKRGLRDRITDERVKRQGITDETESVEHLGAKAAVEAAVVGERIEMLDEQLASLRRTLSRLKGMDAGK
ncbi:MAG: hypothetical protein ACRC33_08765 [Gemmataceae bacterium]